MATTGTFYEVLRLIPASSLARRCEIFRPTRNRTAARL
jgi:hypothetical protein